MLYFFTGDGMGPHNGQAFTTKDSDNDTSGKNCAKAYKGGWWYYNCFRVNINGLYIGNKSGSTGMIWTNWKKNQSMKKTSMKIRRKSTN